MSCNKLWQRKFSKWIKVLLMWTIGSSSVAPVVHGWGTGPLYSSYFWMCKVLAPVERSRLGVTIRTEHTTYIHFCMCVQEKLNVRMEVQAKKLEKFLNTFMWLQREVFISHNPGTSDEFNWRNPIWWLKILDLENWSWQSPDIKWDKEPTAEPTQCRDVPLCASHDSLMFNLLKPTGYMMQQQV